MAHADSAQPGKPAPDLEAGKAAFLQSCSRCHGAGGAGDGRDAARLFPRPRDLTEGIFKFRSTASGTPPTDADLFETVTHGLNAGGMPDWSQLDETTRWHLVEYVKSLSTAFTDAQPEPVNLGQDPGARHADLAQGRAAYDTLGCAACHGPHGRANGTSAPTLVDNWEHATRPANLTQGWNYRGGSGPQAIATRLISGIDGSPMPSYAEAATPDELWQLAYYVRSLQHTPRWAAIVRVPAVEGAPPESVDDPRWVHAERVDVRLRIAPDSSGEIAVPLTVTAMSVQGLHDDAHLSLKLSWFDATQDPNDTPDALAVAFPKADALGDVVTLQTWPLPASPLLDLAVWSSSDGGVQQAVVHDYDGLLQRTVRPSAALSSHAIYEDGQWTVVLTRPLPAHATQDASRFTPVAFAVWDGAIQPHRAVSAWLDLDLQEPVALEHAAKPGAGMPLVGLASAAVCLIGLGLIVRRKR